MIITPLKVAVQSVISQRIFVVVVVVDHTIPTHKHTKADDDEDERLLCSAAETETGPVVSVALHLFIR